MIFCSKSDVLVERFMRGSGCVVLRQVMRSSMRWARYKWLYRFEDPYQSDSGGRSAFQHVLGLCLLIHCALVDELNKLDGTAVLFHSRLSYIFIIRDSPVGSDLEELYNHQTLHRFPYR